MNFIFRFIAGVFGGNSLSPSRPAPSLAPLPVVPAPTPALIPIPIPTPNVEKNEDGIVLINSAKFAAILGVDITTFNRYRRRGVIPPPIEKPGRNKRWLMSDVDAWMATGPWLSREYKHALDHRSIRALLDLNQRPEA